MKSFKIFRDGFMVVFSIFFIYFSTPMIFDEIQFLLNSSSAQGVIVSIRDVREPMTFWRSWSKHTSILVDIKYTDHTNQEITYVDSIHRYGYVSAQNLIGEQIPIRFVPGDPKATQNTDFVTYWLHQFGSLILVFLAGLVVGLRTFRKNYRMI